MSFAGKNYRAGQAAVSGAGFVVYSSGMKASLKVFAALAAPLTLVGLGWLAMRFFRQEAPLYLSVFEPHATGCVWLKFEVHSHRGEQLAVFPADCTSVQVTWSKDAARALVWFTPAGFASEEDMLYLVDLRRRTTWRLPRPPLGDAQTYRFAGDAEIVAFTENQQINLVPSSTDQGRQNGAQEVLEFHGEHFAPLAEGPGQNALAHALRLRMSMPQASRHAGRYSFGMSSDWQVIETVATRCCVEGALGVAALAMARRLPETASDSTQTTSATPLTESPNSTKPDLGALFEHLSRLAPPSPAFAWFVLKRPTWHRSLVFRSALSSPPRVSGTLFFEAEGNVTPVANADFESSDILQTSDRGFYLLISEWQTGMNPHLYDMRTGRLVYAASVASSVSFWPALR